MTTTSDALPRLDQAPNRLVLIWGAIGLIVLAGVVSVAALLTLGDRAATLTPLSPTSPGTIRAVALDDDRMVVVTADNKLALWANGKMTTERQLPYLIGAFARLEAGEFAAGDVVGQVTVFDSSLQPVQSFTVPGRVSGLAATPDGDLVVTYGSGPAAHDYRVDRVDRAGRPKWQVLVDFPTRDVIVANGRAVYGNVSGEVGALADGGQPAWKTLLEHEATRLAIGPAPDTFVAGDVRGGVYLLGADGGIVWRQSVSEYAVEALVVHAASGTIVAGTADGSAFVLDTDGKLLFGTRLAESPVVALLPDDGAVTVVNQSGDRVQLNVSGLRAVQDIQRLRIAWYAAVAVLACLALGLGIAGIGRTRASVVTQARRIYRARLAYLLLAPAMLLILVFSYYPAGMAFYLSFTNFSLSGPVEFVGLRNFLRLPQDPFFTVGIRNMLILLGTSVIKHLTVPLLVAELIFWMRSERVRYWFRTAFVVPAIVPGIVAVLLWKMIWAPQIGLVNQVLQAVGLGHLQRAWLGEEETALLAIILTGFPWVDIFAFLVYLGGLLSINSEMFEAAAVDGATWLTRFLRIDVPSLLPQFRLVLFFTFVGSLQSFAGIWVLTCGGPGTATYVPALEMYIIISRAAEFGYASAIGFVLAAAVMAVVLLRLRLESERDSSAL